MAINGYFFDARETSDGYDRVYSAGDFSRYLEGIVGTGVIPSPSTALQVFWGGAMNIEIYPGSAWIQGHKLEVTESYTMTLHPTSQTADDFVSIVAFASETNRMCGIKEVHSTKSGLTPRHDEDAWELILAEVVIPAGATTLSPMYITDYRANSEKCGYCAGLIQQIDTTTLWNDYRTAQQNFVTNADAAISEIETEGAATIERISRGAQGAFLGLKKYEGRMDVSASSLSARWISVNSFFETSPDFDAMTDTLEVYRNGLKLIEGYDYELRYYDAAAHWRIYPLGVSYFTTDRRTGELINRHIEMSAVVYKPQKPAAFDFWNGILDAMAEKSIYGFDECKVYTKTKAAEADADYISFPLVVNSQPYATADALQVSVNGSILNASQYVVNTSMGIMPVLRVGVNEGTEPYGAIHTGDIVRATYVKPNVTE